MRSLYALLVVLFLFAACSRQSGNIEERKTYWRALVSNELPPGTSRESVEAFFSRYRLEHSYDEQSRTFQAIERNVAGDSVVSFSVIFSCPLNSAGSLVACVVSSAGTGP